MELRYFLGRTNRVVALGVVAREGQSVGFWGMNKLRKEVEVSSSRQLKLNYLEGPPHFGRKVRGGIILRVVEGEGC